MSNKIFILAIATALFSPAYALDTTQQTEMVTAHNKWREEVGTPAIKWSASLATPAQAWADNLKGKGCKLEHSGAAGLGENVFSAGAVTWSDGKTEAQAVTSTQVTDAWGGEKKDYTYDTNTCAEGKACGHYTQVVWKATTEVGCGSAVCDDKSQVWVCNYTPAGNMAGEKPY